ncbi:MAG: gamma-glutamylcyclotransferase [Snowella sp.]|nr:gamma-glutamylcyclotransferase [Snowella sp.]
MNVFVYGTLKPGERNYPTYCQGKAIAEHKVYTYGKLYHLCLGYPGMTAGQDKITGYLLTFADQSVLAELDELETYDPQVKPEQNEYQRQLIPIYDLEDHYLGEAWGYVMTPEKIKAFQGMYLPSGCWTELTDPKKPFSK